MNSVIHALNKDDVQGFEMPNHTGFVAGTLVHTDQGLVPIDQINVGDLVLSKPESGDVAYTRVLKTFKSPEKHRIMRVGFTVPNVRNPTYHDLRMTLSDAQIAESIRLSDMDESDDQDATFYLYCTENHPFWTKEHGWSAASLIPDLGFDVTLENKDGLPLMHSVTMTLETPLFKTQIDQIAVLRDLNDKVDSASILGVIDFKSGRPVIIRGVHEICGGYDEADIYRVGAEDFIDLSKDATHRLIESLNVGGLIVGFELFKFKTANNDYFSKDFYSKYDINELEDKYNSSIDYDYYKDFIYNIEVEDFHTYFVGEAGILVNTRPTPN